MSDEYSQCVALVTKNTPASECQIRGVAVRLIPRVSSDWVPMCCQGWDSQNLFGCLLVCVNRAVAGLVSAHIYSD